MNDFGSAQSQDDKTPRKRQKQEPTLSPCNPSNSNFVSQNNSKIANIAGELVELHIKLSESTAIASAIRKIGELLVGEASNLEMEVEGQKERIKLVEMRLAQEIQTSHVSLNNELQDISDPGESQLKSRINQIITKVLRDNSRSRTLLSPTSQESQIVIERRLAVAEDRVKLEMQEIKDHDRAFQGLQESVVTASKVIPSTQFCKEKPGLASATEAVIEPDEGSIEVLPGETDDALDNKSNTEEHYSSPSNLQPNPDDKPMTIRVGNDYCVRVSSSRWLEIDWKAHFSHKMSQKFVCNECSLITRTYALMQDHIWVEHYGGIFECTLCRNSPHTFITRNNIGRHYRTHHAEDFHGQIPGGTRRRSKYLSREDA